MTKSRLGYQLGYWAGLLLRVLSLVIPVAVLVIVVISRFQNLDCGDIQWNC